MNEEYNPAQKLTFKTEQHEKNNPIEHFELKLIEKLFYIMKSRLFITVFTLALGVAVGINLYQSFDEPWITRVTQSETIEELNAEIDLIDDEIIEKKVHITHTKCEIRELRIKREVLTERLLREIEEDDKLFTR